MISVCILGSTGSIGTNTLDIIRRNPDRFRADFLTAHQNAELLIAQIKEFQPKAVVITDDDAYHTVAKANLGISLLKGTAELNYIAAEAVDVVVNALVGAAGVEPTLAAIKAGNRVALANKETLVTAGSVVMAAAKASDVDVFPIDSEHSAIWQCLVGEDWSDIKKIILTASGGPFRGKHRADLEAVTVDQALAHPNWKMGAKITIDSATLMNKGFEVMETFWLYGIGTEQIEVVVHPQSIIHSMVEFVDGSFKAQLGVPDMRVPIQYALTYPKRAPLDVEPLSFVDLKTLTFESPDVKTFRCLQLAFDALKEGGTMGAVLNASNEVTNQAFRDGALRFNQIGDINAETMTKHKLIRDPDVKALLEADQWARKTAAALVKK